MRKIASPQELQARLLQLLDMSKGPERPSRQKLATELRTLAQKVLGQQKIATIDDHDTLSGLLEMEIESLGGYERDPDVPREVEQAAEAYDRAVEKTLKEWITKNMGKFRVGDGPLRRAKKPEHVVEVLMNLRGGAGYLYFMEAEGHGVGTWDGDWDILFVDPKSTIRELSRYMAGKTRSAYQKLKDALMNAAFEAMGEEDEEEEW